MTTNPDPVEVAIELSERLFDKIKHGEIDHQEWLFIELFRWFLHDFPAANLAILRKGQDDAE